MATGPEFLFMPMAQLGRCLGNEVADQSGGSAGWGHRTLGVFFFFFFLEQLGIRIAPNTLASGTGKASIFGGRSLKASVLRGAERPRFLGKARQMWLRRKRLNSAGQSDLDSLNLPQRARGSR